MPFDNLRVAHESGVAILTIDRPQRLNALDGATLDELAHAVRELHHNDSIRCVIVTGAGDRAFVAGADIHELSAATPESAQRHALHGQAVFNAIETLGKPTIAAINGVALGGGCELAMACTLRLAAETSRLGLPEINLGLIPGFAGTQRLSRLVGKARALELILMGDTLTAADALSIGLVNRVVPAAALMTECRALARTLAAKPSVAVRCALQAINGSLEMPFGDGCQLEAALFGMLAATEDMKEGTRAFLEKRKPAFRGR
jgi:enoyl-CoA hydratase